MSIEHWRNDTGKGKRKYSREGRGVKRIRVSFVQHISHVNSSVLHREKLATNGLSHGTAFRESRFKALK